MQTIWEPQRWLAAASQSWQHYISGGRVKVLVRGLALACATWMLTLGRVVTVVNSKYCHQPLVVQMARYGTAGTPTA
jgi:hypothetical protein